MAGSYIPRTAQLVGVLEVERPEGRAIIRAYRGAASLGYRSDYQRLERGWVEVDAPELGQPERTRMTVPRFEAAIVAELAQLATDLPKHPACRITRAEGVYAPAIGR